MEDGTFCFTIGGAGGSGSDGEQQEDWGALLEDAVHTGALQLSNRMIQATPSAIWACAGLLELDLSSNSLSELPAAIENLRSLELLNISWNKLTELPSSMRRLTSLTTFRAAYNQISTLPTQVASLPSLTLLDMSDNKLSCIPSDICYSTSLTELRVDYNSIQELPRELYRASSLSEIGLEGNPLRLPPKHVAQQGTQVLLAYLKALGSRPSSSSTAASTGSQEAAPASGSRFGAGIAAPQLLVVDPSADRDGDQYVGELVPSPGADHRPYDEEMEMERDDGETDWSSIGKDSMDTVANIMDSLQLPETDGYLGSAADAVLQRTANLLAIGLQEMHSGRPLSAGGSAVDEAKPGAARQTWRPGTAAGSRSRRPQSAAAATMMRSGTAYGASSSGRPSARPLTAARPGTAVVHSGGSRQRPSTAQPRSSSSYSSSSSSSSFLSSQQPTWLHRAGVDAGRGGLQMRQARGSCRAGGSSLAAPEEEPSSSTYLMSMPALTFPLASSISKLSRRSMGVRVTSASGQEIPLRSSSPAEAQSHPDSVEHVEGEESDEEIVQRVLRQRNPELLKAMNADTRRRTGQQGGEGTQHTA
mmetsp:Transcript_19609/g.54514  ORF Transcript_19609/g.54514 Transcript_19609/m.54514 type:complete len:589 (+) Transcript_19609:192-1958(+)